MGEDVALQPDGAGSLYGLVAAGEIITIQAIPGASIGRSSLTMLQLDTRGYVGTKPANARVSVDGVPAAWAARGADW